MKLVIFAWAVLMAFSTVQNLAALEPGSGGSPEIRPPAGRLAIVADGNSPDPDDIGATSVMLGLLMGSRLQDRLVHLSHSCDLDPFSNPGKQAISIPDELRRQEKLQEVCRKGVELFGPFRKLREIFNCRTAQNAAVDDLCDAIDASSVDDPLWIIVAGEPDIIAFALQRAKTSRRRYVHVVSHHPANDNSGDFFTWQDLLDFGVIEHQIGDQNVGLQSVVESWNWASNHPVPGISWIWSQLKYAEQDGVVAFQANKFDCSDAGMLYWWITGAENGGNRNATPVEIKDLLIKATTSAGDSEIDSSRPTQP